MLDLPLWLSLGHYSRLCLFVFVATKSSLVSYSGATPTRMMVMSQPRLTLTKSSMD